MLSERRRKERIQLGEICYIQIEPDNGGVVVDLSEDGLSFQAAQPVDATGTISFSFLSSGKYKIAASGELVWTSHERRSGGVRFNSLSPAALQHMHELLTRTPAPSEAPPPAPASAEAATATAAETASEATRLPPPESVAAEPASLSGTPAPAHSFGSGHSMFGLGQKAQDADNAWLPLMEEELSSARRQSFLRGVLLGIVLAVVAGTGLWAMRNHWERADVTAAQPPVQTSQGLTPAPPAAPVSPAPPLTPPAGSSVATASSSPSAAGQTPPHVSPPSPEANATLGSSSPVDTDTDRRYEPGQRELKTAERYLSSKSGAPNYRDAEQWLWAAVRKGNTQAEIELSDLYAKGLGVKRNCEQARVLLLAAERKGNALARGKLDDLANSACRVDAKYTARTRNTCGRGVRCIR